MFSPVPKKPTTDEVMTSTMSKSLVINEPIGLYIHIPFCERLCHYCDFAKTANYDDDLVVRYFDALSFQLSSWVTFLEQRSSGFQGFDSVFIGGGTPSLFGANHTINPYKNIFARLKGALTPYCEVTLECNPVHASFANLDFWRSLGFNRISLGIQSFEDEGLMQLSRDHDGKVAYRALENSVEIFENVSIDLIYGWPGQTLSSWKRDLGETIGKVQHLSCYNLTYEPRTTLGRKMQRGKVKPLRQELEAELYLEVCRQSARLGYLQEEVSNWSLPGFETVHNAKYWQRKSCLAIGTGAHGFLQTQDGVGFSYSYSRNERKTVRDFEGSEHKSFLDGVKWEESRTQENALIEMIGAGLRTKRGIDIERMGRFVAVEKIEAFKRRSEKLDWPITFLMGRLHLHPEEWFRENYWAGEIISALA